ncbi:MAG: phosphatidate cytidylyltransferase [Alcanivorax sp.]|uniref:Phosphatidate cytidylyltransferase n=1 Tax=Alloalcanivorax marinus TaxID=1177169 RepID=A0A9Q3UMH6_9GAMM|nr:phosphatidate cytidylyltransferase [Alloalcanivorax marinus]MBM7334753.1 phosphatidate cytidylyltransferase [Alloalcanivorax marinus]MCC4307723.1 phosphatidate cytidylyltransferase [Alloalcanivorax marinus]MCU5787663.1 phosphatidate cytidylyltransferase [Alloalcanivorax marinus]
MLKLRVITALVLLPVVLGAVFGLERLPFAVVAGAFFLVGGWEWAGMIGRLSVPGRLLWCLSLAALMVAAELFRPAWLFTLLPLWWLLALVAVLGYPRNARYWFRPAVMVPVGWLVLVPSWMAVVELQDHGALGLAGPWALLFILVWVWAADTGAYFAGRALGRHKLAPRVSPGKTVEGLVGGVLLALLVVAAVFYTGWLEARLPALMVAALLTVLASVLGDLFESMIKRERGIKDSGTVLPGHGGMLDRIDSVTAALPVALAGLSWFDLPGGQL